MILNKKPIYDIKPGDRIHIFNTQLDQKIAVYDNWKVFSALVTKVNSKVIGTDDYYQLEFENNKSGWYDSGYLFNVPSPEFVATPLESVLQW